MNVENNNENIEKIDENLSFLDEYVNEALKYGANPYLPPSQQPSTKKSLLLKYFF